MILDKGRVVNFCSVNNIPCPGINVVSTRWNIRSCAYYRPQTIHICIPCCSRPAGEVRSRNWNWPGSTTDRLPTGVLCHELGHHVDWLTGDNKRAYSSDYSTYVFQASGEEKPITSYCDNHAEWFAEMFRLFVTNHALLKALRPGTWKELSRRWKPISGDDWIVQLGADVPTRIVENLKRKISLVK